MITTVRKADIKIHCTLWYNYLPQLSTTSLFIFKIREPKLAQKKQERIAVTIAPALIYLWKSDDYIHA